jgi:hypothetical protein
VLPPLHAGEGWGGVARDGLHQHATLRRVADATLAGEPLDSSAADEQSKFTACIDIDSSDLQHVIAKIPKRVDTGSTSLH